MFGKDATAEFDPFVHQLKQHVLRNTKRLEILKDAIPKLARVGLLWPPGTGIATELQLKETRAAALALKVKLEEIETQPDAKGLESAFQIAKQKQVGAIVTIGSRRFFAERKRIIALAVKYRLPAIYFQKDLLYSLSHLLKLTG